MNPITPQCYNSSAQNSYVFSIFACAIKRNILGFCLSIIISIAAVAEAQENNPRTNAYLFKYHGPKVPFDQFRGILKDKIWTLRDELELLNVDEKYDHHKKIKLQEQKEFLPSDYDDVEDFWNVNKEALELLSGTILIRNGKVYVFSRAFLFMLKGSLQKKSISIKLELEDKEFGSVRDTHSLVILYAIAMDAKRLNYPNDVVVSYLSKAKQIAEDLDMDYYKLKSLKKAIQDALQSLTGISP
jgi:hypothetical protein